MRVSVDFEINVVYFINMEKLIGKGWDFKTASGSEFNDFVVITSRWIRTDFYSASWVDVDKWDSFSSFCSKVCQESYGNSDFVEVVDFTYGNFRWPRGFNYKNLPLWCINSLAPDWIWTKVVLHDTLGDLTKAPHDLVAMLADDIARYWWLATVFTSVLDVRSISSWEEKYRNMMSELWNIATEQKFVILNWETAELGLCVWSPNLHAKTPFNWSWMMTGVYHPDKMIFGNKVQAGDILVALKQDWFRSNWISAVRKAFALEYWDNYYESAPRDELQAATSPSNIYARTIAEANWWYSSDFVAPINMTAIANLSGWAMKGKVLEDMLWKMRLSAEFNNLFPIPDIVRKVVKWSKKSDKPISSYEEIYSTWGAGQWMIVAVRSRNDADKLIKLFASRSIEAQIAWVVVETPEGKEPSITITNIR